MDHNDGNKDPFLHYIIYKWLNESFEIVHSSKTSVGNRADNVAGELDCYEIIFRRVNKEKEEVVNIVIKMKIEGNEYMERFFEQCCIFPREIQCYQDVITGLKLFQLERGIPEDKILNITPALYASGLSPISFIALEDLNQLGFKMPDKLKMLNHSQIALVLKNLAVYHSTSFAMCRSKNVSGIDLYPTLKESIFLKGNEDFPGAPIIMCFEKLIEIYESTPSHSELGTRMKKFSGLSWSKLVDLFNDQSSPFLAITHGDLWTNNILFKYALDDTDQAYPIDIKLVDFQLSRYCSIALELTYFLYTSTTSEMRKTNLENLLDIYYRSFVNALNTLKFRIPLNVTFKCLQSEMTRCLPFVLYFMPFALAMQQVTLADMTEYQEFVKNTGIEISDSPMADELVWRMQRGSCKQRILDVMYEIENSGII